jgi:hypothetical protein
MDPYKKKKHLDKMLTRKTKDSSKRNTLNSDKRKLYEDNDIDRIRKRKKKPSNYADKIIKEEKLDKLENKSSNKKNDQDQERYYYKKKNNISGSSSDDSDAIDAYTDNDDEEEEQEDDDDIANNDANVVSEKAVGSKNTSRTYPAQMNGSDTDNSLIKHDTKKKKKEDTFFSLKEKSAILWFARNDLFKKIKILGDEHLETNGKIINEALRRIEFDSSKQNFRKYVMEAKRLLKTTMCSRRGYVKRKFGVLYRGMWLHYFLLIEIFLLTICLLDLYKSNQVDNEFYNLLKNVYNADSINDMNVRKAWYIFGLHFLPLVSKEWKECLHSSRLRNKPLIYDVITTSDEALARWFIDLWAPKIKFEADKGWPQAKKSYGEGEQEIKARQNDYVHIHQQIKNFKCHQHYDILFTWNTIFWDEVVSNNPSAFEEKVEIKKPNTLIIEGHEALIPLPGIDDDDDFNLQINQIKTVENLISKENEYNLETPGMHSLEVQSEMRIINNTDVVSFDQNPVIQKTSYEENKQETIEDYDFFDEKPKSIQPI